MTLTELKKAMVSQLKTMYPDKQYKYYGTEVKEGYKRPCFFTKLEPVDTERVTCNTDLTRCTFYITYLQQLCDEADILQKADGIRKLFGGYVKVGERAADVTGFHFDMAGNDGDAMEISIDIEFFDRVERMEKEGMMDSLSMELKGDGEAWECQV